MPHSMIPKGGSTDIAGVMLLERVAWVVGDVIGSCLFSFLASLRSVVPLLWVELVNRFINSLGGWSV